MKIRGSIECRVHTLLNHKLPHALGKALQLISITRLAERGLRVAGIVLHENYREILVPPARNKKLNVLLAVRIGRFPPVIAVPKALLGVDYEKDRGLRHLVSVSVAVVFENKSNHCNQSEWHCYEHQP